MQRDGDRASSTDPIDHHHIEVNIVTIGAESSSRVVETTSLLFLKRASLIFSTNVQPKTSVVYRLASVRLIFTAIQRREATGAVDCLLSTTSRDDHGDADELDRMGARGCLCCSRSGAGRVGVVAARGNQRIQREEEKKAALEHLPRAQRS